MKWRSASRAACVLACPLLAASTLAQTPGEVLSEQKISDTAGSFTGTLDDSDRFGRAVAAIGDIDNDGTDDLAVGAFTDDDGGADRGAVWILFMNSDGTVKGHQKISDTVGGFTPVLDDGDHFGFSTAGMGDVNSDGVPDVLVGARNDDDGGSNRGAAYILLMNTDGTVKVARKISSTSGIALANSDQFGQSVTTLDDLDGDGVVDLLVGAWGDDGDGSNRGAAWVVFMNANATVKGTLKISSNSGGLTGPLADEDRFGAAAASLGDVDGDGNTDAVIGAPGDDDGGTDRGAVYVVLLNSDGTVKSEVVIDSDAGVALDDGDAFGIAVANAGDVDGNGSADLAVGAQLDDDGGTDRGAIYVLLLDSTIAITGQSKISATSGGFGGTLADGDGLGCAVAGIGDLDGDGKVDLAGGAFQDDDGGTDRGAVWVVNLESCDSSTFSTRNGSGLNPALLSAGGAPTLGTTWTVFVDCSGFAPGFAAHVMVGSPTSGVFTKFGELLINVSSAVLSVNSFAHAGGVSALNYPLPDDPSLCGLPFYTQAFCGGAPGGMFTNALDGATGY